MIVVPFATRVLPHYDEISRWAVDDLDPELRAEILRSGWVDANPDPGYFDLSVVRTPADRSAFRNRDLARQGVVPPHFPAAPIIP